MATKLLPDGVASTDAISVAARLNILTTNGGFDRGAEE
jgi:hypothetical protein